MEGMLTPSVLDTLLTMPETLTHLFVVWVMYKIIMMLINKLPSKTDKETK